MARNTFLARTLLRARGELSADDRDVERALRRALKRAGRGEGHPVAVQVAGEPLAEEDYARWRKRKLRRGALISAPELAAGRYALVGETGLFVNTGNRLAPGGSGRCGPAAGPRTRSTRTSRHSSGTTRTP